MNNPITAKTLYITDLDSTFLQRGGQGGSRPSRFALDALKLLKEKGVHFTYATARAPLSACRAMAGAAVSAPAVMMNGVIMYDVENAKYISVEYMVEDAYAKCRRIFAEYVIDAFVYSMVGGEFCALYEPLLSETAKHYQWLRVPEYGDAFVQTSDSAAAVKNVFYLTGADKYETLKPAYERINREVSGVYTVLSNADHYDYHYLEVASGKVSKGTGVQWLRENCGYEKIVGFGDNLNDLPLFKACDGCYAVLGATEELKSAADSVIGACEDDAVIKKILELEGIL